MPAGDTAFQLGQPIADDAFGRAAASLIDPASATATKVAMLSGFLVRYFRKPEP
jgi:hypothetical protein